jgi:3-hydroxyacyl-CoA dehydrogenase
VEVVPHAGTAEAVIQRVIGFLHAIGQQPVRINVETPGFVLNRLQVALFTEIYSLVSRGVISASDLDNAVTSGLGLRLALSGPFMNASLSGGGGPDGFRRTTEHLMPASEHWRKDMEANRWEDSPEGRQKLYKEVDDLFEGYSGRLPQALQARNEAIVELIALKRRKGLR